MSVSVEFGATDTKPTNQTNRPTAYNGREEKTMKQTIENTTTHATTTAPAFADLLRAYETAVLTDGDTTAPLLALATATAHSVLKKCIDPQRKTAPDKDTASNNGINPALVDLKRGIVTDLAILDNIATASDKATALQFNKDGDLVSVVVDKDAERAVNALIEQTLSDGIDLVQTAVVAILEQTADHASGAGFMETPYTTRRLARKVYIKAGDSAKWEDVETTPIQEVYRAVRREIQNSKAVQTDPRNGYLYIEDVTADPDSDKTETIYRRLQKWADLGGYTRDGHYTADKQTAVDYETTLALLNLSDRQARIISLRMQGYGNKAIATYLGLSLSSVKTQIARVQDKCKSVGFTCDMWAEMNAGK